MPPAMQAMIVAIQWTAARGSIRERGGVTLVGRSERLTHSLGRPTRHWPTWHIDESLSRDTHKERHGTADRRLVGS